MMMVYCLFIISLQSPMEHVTITINNQIVPSIACVLASLQLPHLPSQMGSDQVMILHRTAYQMQRIMAKSEEKPILLQIRTDLNLSS